MNDSSNSNRIERSIVLNASREKVWQALTDAEQFGAWFGVDLKGKTFVPGERVRGLLTGCGHDDTWFDAVIDRINPQDLFSYRWHPLAIDPNVNYDEEEPTLVTFTLTDGPDNKVLLTVVESGFDHIPAHRRMEAFRMHNTGWDHQVENIQRYVSA